MTVFARIDHAGGAAEAGLHLRPTELLIFGSAKGGTLPMEANQTIGIDLPLKALAWQDEAGRTWRYVGALAATLSSLVRKATESP
jgi:uncharacterized protein (DUF302 family)